MFRLAFAALLAVAAAPGASHSETVISGCGYAPPLLYWMDEKGCAGFAFDVLNEAARREGIRIEWRRTAGSVRMERELEEGVLDLLPAAVDTEARRAKFFVSRPWWVSELSVIARAQGSAENSAALRGKRLALASPVYLALAERSFPGVVPLIPDAQSIGARNAATAVCTGAADAALVQHLDMHEFLLNPPESCHGLALDTFDTDAVIQVCVLARRAREVAAARLRNRIDELTAEGILAAIAARHRPMSTRNALLLTQALRDRYDRRALSQALIWSLALLAIGALFYIRQHRTRKRLARSEARYQSLFDLAAAGIVHLDGTTGRFIAVNQEFCKLTGYSRKELVGGLSFSDLTYPEDLATSVENYQRLVAGEAPSYSQEKRYVRKDGEIVWVRGDVAGVRLGGKLLYAVAIAQDITERKKAEQALRESEDRLRLAIDSTGLGAFDFNPQTRRMVWSDFAKRQFGLPPEAEIDYDTFLHGIHPDDRHAVEASIQNAQRPESGGQYAAEYRARGLRDGKERWLAALGRVFFDAQGRAVRFIGVRRDVTEQRAAEQALRESERHFRELADSMPQLVWMARPDGRITYYNQQWKLQLGIAEPPPAGQAVADTSGELEVPPRGPDAQDAAAEHKRLDRIWPVLMHAEDRDRCQSHWRRSLETGETCQVECRLRTATGVHRWFLVRAVPVRDDLGRVARWFGTCTDIDESKIAEERLRQSQKMESVGLLAGGIAHDFNNLLTGILGNASLAITEVAPQTAAKLANVIGAAERGAHLTRQLLAYSGKGRFVVKDLDLSEAVRGMVDLVRLSVPKNVAFRLDFVANLSLVRIDPSQLQQVVMNLMINAGEAIGEGTPGTIHLATGEVVFDRPFVDALGQEAAAGRYVWLEVADTGTGMDPETRRRIFDPFFTTKFTGRGLGLAAVSGIVRAQHGALTLESAPGEGSRFRVHFPAVAPHPERNGAPRGNVLVLDDDAYVREFLSEAIRRQGYQTRTACDAAEVLALDDEELGSLDAMIVDVGTADRPVSEMLRVMKERQPRLRVLVTSGFTEFETHQSCTLANGAAFLRKPYSTQELAEKLEALLE